MTQLQSTKPTTFKTAISMLFPGPALQEDALLKLSSKDFAFACANKKTTSVVVQENASGFALFVSLKNSSQVHVLVTTGNLVRNWASLNSLIFFLKNHSFNLAEVTIRLHSSESTPA